MADEISYAVQIAYSKNGRSQTKSATSNTLTVTADTLQSGVVATASASHTAIDLGSVAVPGLSHFENLDSTNTIEIGYDDGGAFVTAASLAPGMEALFKPTGAVYQKSSAGTPLLSYTIFGV